MDFWPELRFRSGERILDQGEVGSSVFLVRSGVVRLSSVSEDGREAILGLAGPGHVFGEGALCGNRVSTPAAMAESDCSVSPIPAAALVDWGPVSVALVGLARRLADTTADLERLLHHDVHVRLAGVITRLAERFGRERDGGLVIGLALTQRELACMVGASRETVNRSLANLCSLGWMRRRGRMLQVDDLAAVRRRAREYG